MERHLRFPSAEEQKKQRRGLIAIALRQLYDGSSVNAYLSAPDNVDPKSFIVIFVYDVAIQRRVSISK